MHNFLLYVITVLIWGTTWFAIKMQVGLAPTDVSITYRTILAAILLVGLCKSKGFSLRFRLQDHFFVCALGLSMFSLHQLFVYGASQYLVSGVVSVVFSSVSFLSVFYNYLFFKTKPTLNIILGVITGILGLCIFFWDEVSHLSLESDTVLGIEMALCGSCIFALGGIISKRNHRQGIETMPSIAMGMVYGAMASLIYTLIHGSSFVFPVSWGYWGSLMYLVIFGSIVAFLCYLKLIKNMGPELAGYTSVLFPAVALFVSFILEGYEGSLNDFIGFSFVLIGNILVMRKKPVFELKQESFA